MKWVVIILSLLLLGCESDKPMYVLERNYPNGTKITEDLKDTHVIIYKVIDMGHSNKWEPVFEIKP